MEFGGSTVGKFLATCSKSCLIIISATFLISALIGRTFPYFSAVMAVILFLSTLFRMSPTYKKPTYVFLSLGLIVMILNQSSFDIWIKGLNAGLTVVAIMNIMQVFCLPMELGHYEKSLSVFLCSYAKVESVIFAFLAALSHTLAVILNMGSVLVMLAIIGEDITGQLKKPTEFVSKAIARGYAMVFFWAPSSATMMILVQTFNLEWRKYVGPAITMAIAFIIVGFLFELPRLSKEPLKPIALQPNESPKNSIFRLSHLVIVVVTISFAVAFLEIIKFSDSTGRILLVSFAIAIIWLLFFVKSPEFMPKLRDYKKNKMGQSADICIFFMAMSFFSTAFGDSQATKIITVFFEAHADVIGKFILFILPLLVIALAMMGLHSFASLVLIGSLVTVLPISASPYQMALSLALGACLSYTVSPFSGVALMISNHMKKPSFSISLKYNYIYCIVCYFLGTISISMFF